jgi:hypothetical protein
VVVLSALGWIAVCGPVRASATDAPILLTVDTPQGARTFDLARLDALPQQRFRTTTLWTFGKIEFSGPALRDVLAAAGADAAMPVDAYALDDYRVVFAPGTIGEGVPIVATRMNGATFGPRDLGPLWVVYPFDSDAGYRSEIVFSRSIWQLNRLVVRPGRD